MPKNVYVIPNYGGKHNIYIYLLCGDSEVIFSTFFLLWIIKLKHIRLAMCRFLNHQKLE